MHRLSQVAPNSVWRWLEAGEEEESAGDLAKALIDYRAVLQIDSRHRGIHFRIGRSLETRSQQSGSSSDTQAALSEFEQELQVDPLNANAAYESGVLYSRGGQLDKAEVFFEEALQYHPDFEEAQVGLGGVLVDMGKPELAIPHLKKAASLDPNDGVPYYRLAQAFNALGKTVDAREALSHFQHLHTLQVSQDAAHQADENVTKQTVDPSRP